MLLEGAFVELFQAESADKVLRVELLGHGCDAAPCDGLLTARTERAAPLVVVHFAVGLAIVLEEAAIHKRGEALLHINKCSWTRFKSSCEAHEHRRDINMMQTLQTKHSGCQRQLSAEM